MKHYYLFILFAFALVTGYSQPQLHPVIKATSLQEKAACASSCHTELEAEAAIPNLAGSSTVLQRPLEYIPVTSGITLHNIFYIQRTPDAISRVYAKSYISHIYPSLHYW